LLALLPPDCAPFCPAHICPGFFPLPRRIQPATQRLHKNQFKFALVCFCLPPLFEFNAPRFKCLALCLERRPILHLPPLRRRLTLFTRLLPLAKVEVLRLKHCEVSDMPPGVRANRQPRIGKR
jgi:hypothetical protein